MLASVQTSVTGVLPFSGQLPVLTYAWAGQGPGEPGLPGAGGLIGEPPVARACRAGRVASINSEVKHCTGR